MIVSAALSVHYLLILLQVLLICHVSFGLSLLECLLNLHLFLYLVDYIESPLSAKEVRPADLEDHSLVDLLREESLIDEAYQLLALDVLEVRLNELFHIHAFVFLAHVLFDHLDVLLGTSFLSVLSEGDGALVLFSHVIDKVLSIAYQGTLNRIDQRAGTLGEAVCSAGLKKGERLFKVI